MLLVLPIVDHMYISWMEHGLLVVQTGYLSSVFIREMQKKQLSVQLINSGFKFREPKRVHVVDKLSTVEIVGMFSARSIGTAGIN